MALNTSQIPLGHPIADNSLFVNQQWAFWFNQLTQSLPPSGSGYVIDGTATTYAPCVIYQGLAVNRGANPDTGSIYIAVDTGEIFVAVGGQWQLEIPAFSGDVTSAVGSTTLTLNTVNSTVGTYGNGSTIPQITVDAKGRITNVINTPIIPPVPVASGVNGSIQYNSGGVLGGNPIFRWDTNTQSLFTNNEFVTGTISFTNPLPTFNNLSPLTTKGDLLGHNSSNNIRVPVGTDGQVLTADSTVAAGVSWQNPTGGGGVTPYYIPDGDTFTNELYKQNLFNFPITVDGQIVVDGLLIEV